MAAARQASAMADGDPLVYGFPLPYRSRYYPMGFAVDLITNSNEVLEAATTIWSGLPKLSEADAVEMRVAVRGASSGPLRRAEPRGQGHLVSVVESVENFAVADLERGFSFAWLTEDAVREPGYFRYYFLELLVYLMIDARHLAPVHASCIALDSGAAILCGGPGAGKTSLAYACARRGWTYLSDDAIHVVRERNDFSVVGRPNWIRFRDSARGLFPELENFPSVRRPNGKLDIEIDTKHLEIATRMQQEARCLVFLNREAGAAGAAIHPVDPEFARRSLEEVVCFGDEPTRQDQRRALGRLLTLPIVQLTYRDIDPAEQALRQLVCSAGD